MPTENLLNAETKSFGDIVKGDKIYKIPIFQRDYSWNEEHWEDLWTDIITRKSENSKHYMGSLVFIGRDKKTYEVIDGQQRLTTLTLIILAIVKNLKDLIDGGIDVDNNEKRVDLLMNEYVGKKSLQSLNFSNKLILNEENEPFYSSYLIQFRTPTNIKSLSSTNALLNKCYTYYYKKVREEILISNNVDNLIDFVEYLSDNLIFVQISATDDLSAYLIFETLNDRGLDLSVTDLLKNYLFSLVDDNDKKHVKNIWNEILKSVEYKLFPKFLRHYWLSENKVVSEKELFKIIKRNVSSPKKAFDLLVKLNEIAPVYSALSNPLDQLWSGNKRAKKSICELNLFNVKQCYPLMLVSFFNLEAEEYVKVFKFCSVISFRYSTIAGLNPNVLEEAYNKTCLNIVNKKNTTARQVFEDLKNYYIEDDTFKEAFSKKIISTKRGTKLVRYILYSIENHLNSTSLDPASDTGTIEHILPENPNSTWNMNFPQEVQEDYIYRLGNYTLLEEKINKDIGREEFSIKINEYKKSRYRLTNDINYVKWNISNLNERQSILALQANALWKIDL